MRVLLGPTKPATHWYPYSSRHCRTRDDTCVGPIDDAPMMSAEESGRQLSKYGVANRSDEDTITYMISGLSMTRHLGIWTRQPWSDRYIYVGGLTSTGSSLGYGFVNIIQGST